MLKLAIALFMTFSASAVAMSPVSAAMSGVNALFILLGLFVVTVASLNAVKTALN